MEYCLTQLIVASKNEVELTKEEYDSIKSAWESILNVRYIEDQWTQLVQNYIELELETHSAAVHHMVNSSPGYDEFQDTLVVFTRRHFNLLQSCRSYLDHTSGHIRKLPLRSLYDAFKLKRSSVYDSSFSFRLMEALRNYAQHEAVPIHSAKFGGQWIASEAERLHRLKFSVSMHIKVDILRNAEGFKSTVLADLDEELDKLDAAEHIRKYLEGLFEIHGELRDQLKGGLEAWKATIRDAIKRYHKVSEGKAAGLAIVQLDSEGEILAKQPIFEDMLKYLEQLQNKYASLAHLSKRFVSNDT